MVLKNWRLRTDIAYLFADPSKEHVLKVFFACPQDGGITLVRTNEHVSEKGKKKKKLYMVPNARVRRSISQLQNCSAFTIVRYSRRTNGNQTIVTSYHDMRKNRDRETRVLAETVSLRAHNELRMRHTNRELFYRTVE